MPKKTPSVESRYAKHFTVRLKPVGCLHQSRARRYYVVYSTDPRNARNQDNAFIIRDMDRDVYQ